MRVIRSATRRLVWLGMIAGLVPAGASARDPGDADAFLQQLYAPYAAGSASDPTGKLAGSLFDPGLLALIRQDQARAGGEVGLLEIDPICDCQDYTALSGIEITVRPSHDGVTPAVVSFKNLGGRTSVGFELVRIAGRWRIHDIAERGIPSLRRFLATGLAAK